MNDNYFSEEYSSICQTETKLKVEPITDLKKIEAPQEMQVEAKKYGVSKPQRIIIKAKIIND